MQKLLMVVMFIVMIFLLLVVCSMFIFMLSGASLWVISLKIFNVGFFGDLEILMTMWSLMFLMLVIIISSSVMFFSFSYMSGLNTNNFVFLYLSFVFSMLWLVLNNNFYWMMFGWDGLGVVSFLLIIFYMNNESYTNGLFTLFQNRFGDLFFVLFIVGMSSMMMWSNLVITWGILFLVIGSAVKSAQFPFNAWLLAAMSAPTPISSLVHSSTLVVAGVYILLQYSYCLVDILDLLKYISLISLFLSTFGLLNENDMKKLIAYSTMSHVSLMMYLLSFGLFKVAYFHLNIHAMFKSLMFMCFGFVMLFSFHSQDKRMVSLYNLNPLVKVVYYFSCMCLAGLPFLSGFFSKDLIIEKFMENSLELSFIFFLLLFLGVSVYYSLKLMMLTKMFISMNVMEKQILGMSSVLFMSLVMIMMINIYLSLVFSLSLELFSFKVIIYMFMVMFFMMAMLTKLNYKTIFYNKMHNFNEGWAVNVYSLDKFIYWNFFVLLEYMSVGFSLKFIILINWWVMVMVLILF